MVGEEISPYTLIFFKLADYEARHRGNRPARIFMSDSMFLKMAFDDKCNYQERATKERKLCGIPLSIFEDDDSKIYLSDEEE